MEILAQFIPVVGNLTFTIVAFVAALCVIVAIHEYGHYIVGRWSGIQAEVFSIGFGPVLFRRTDRRGTQWQIAAFPLGGYVKFLGDSNAASTGADVQTIATANLRRTMHGAPLWARTATVAAGPIFNFILAIAIFAASIMYQGQATDPLTIAEMDPLPDSFINELQPGDELIAVAGLPFDDPDRKERLVDIVPQARELTYDVVRDGTPVSVTGPFLLPPAAFAISPRSAADDARMRVGDVITHVDGQEVYTFMQVQDIVAAAEGVPLELTIWRAGEVFTTVLEPRWTDIPLDEGGFEQRWLMGIQGDVFFTPQTEFVGFGTALAQGADSLARLMRTSLSAMKHIIFGQISTCNLSGPVGIAETSSSLARQGAQSFIWFIGALSAAVGLINLFPIPVLDGGHLVFYAYEAVARRKPSKRVLEAFAFVGLALVMSMMSFTILNDTVLCP